MHFFKSFFSTFSWTFFWDPFFGTLLSTFLADFFSISLWFFFGNLFWHSFGYFFMGMNFHCHHFEYFIMLQDSFVHFFWASFQSFLFFYPSFQLTFENVSWRMNFFLATSNVFWKVFELFSNFFSIFFIPLFGDTFYMSRTA